MMKKAKSALESAERAEKRINTITTVMSKVHVSGEQAERWDKRRQRLHEAVKILSKDQP
jgi:hypothetical protein